jgi:hypothetical protein
MRAMIPGLQSQPELLERFNRRAAERLLGKLIGKQARAPRVLVTDKLRS